MAQRVVRDDSPIYRVLYPGWRTAAFLFLRRNSVRVISNHQSGARAAEFPQFDDEIWRNILRGLNKEFWHQTVTTEQVESYINEQSGIDLSLFFDQYLRTTKIPVFKYKIDGTKVTYHLENVVEGFKYPVKVRVDGSEVWLTPTEKPQTLQMRESDIESFELDRNFYMDAVSE